MVTPKNENDMVPFSLKRKDVLMLISSIRNDKDKYKNNKLLYSKYEELLKELNKAYLCESDIEFKRCGAELSPDPNPLYCLYHEGHSGPCSPNDPNDPEHGIIKK